MVTHTHTFFQQRDVKNIGEGRIFLNVITTASRTQSYKIYYLKRLFLTRISIDVTTQ